MTFDEWSKAQVSDYPAARQAWEYQQARIKELETLVKAARDFIADEHIRRDIDTALLGGRE